ncbi:UDP-glucuronosyl/UDP-glucosyltransferase protein [Dioscorea alata]|uniref:UDP-glucuronosyl/UDP-glucosyltransferase protein n=1 Tax=Dioscorea alata TaxID=55571 RepID=A0ACB7VNC9_DIOAL|nr:UDP-glucuronosyl/UDP-glucosyltransferase protein [Dioscorea alata]
MRSMEKQTLIFIPIPAAGHHASMVELATRLLHHNPSFSATILLIPFHEFPLPSLSTSNPNNLSFYELPHLDPPQPNPNETPATFVSLLVQLYKPQVKEAISALSGDVLVIDFFATTLIDVADEIGIPTYIYFTSNAAMLAVMIHLSILDEEIHQDFEELEEDLIQVPGLPLISPRSLPVSISSKKKQSYAWYLYHGRRFLEARGIIVNTFIELEHMTLRSLSKRITNIYSIGPILSMQKRENCRHECMKWLDEQPEKSVVFLCFGSRGRFGEEQVKEMAGGIERSGKRFLWVMKGLEGMLPEGFEERNREKGVVWKENVPQVEVLSHRAVGGFVTHCGWNSILESLWFGVPMMTWPLYAEQHMNAWLMVKEWGVGVELKVERGGGVVKKEEIENGVRCLMEESNVRVRVMEMMSVCRRAVNDGGSSFASFEGLVKDMLLVKQDS